MSESLDSACRYVIDVEDELAASRASLVKSAFVKMRLSSRSRRPIAEAHLDTFPADAFFVKQRI